MLAVAGRREMGSVKNSIWHGLKLGMWAAVATTVSELLSASSANLPEKMKPGASDADDAGGRGLRAALRGRLLARPPRSGQQRVGESDRRLPGQPPAGAGSRGAVARKDIHSIL